ncbi:ABC transporter substrate-binding protein [Brenneria tiliae]|uniref:ABC transporter substrate-binding protein n=1 Tax=Brenneria tiliae TaxID=2914984 RepID=A0ABT0MRX7_9GAMM|nr:ABC transporter substrate-binding protein [Brenneria tiliae]MCL2892018.1 ABC transporter substrate-binding protein [Brenneria tiliae]
MNSRIIMMLYRVLFLMLLSGVVQAAQTSITVIDMLQRKVSLPGPAKRIVLAESRHVLTLGLLGKDPASKVVGWGDDLQRYSPTTWQALVQQYPTAKNIPILGTTNAGTFSIEAAIAAKPDLVIFTLYGSIPQGLDKLDAAHIPYVFVDFFRQPLTNTVPSLRLLGKVLGQEQQTEHFIVFWQEHMDVIKQRLATIPDRTLVFFHLNPGSGDCCFTSGPGNMSDFIAAAGGHNLGADKLTAPIGQLNIEYILSRNPEFYLVGGGSTVSRNGLQVGPDTTPQQVTHSMRRLMQAPEIGALPAVITGRTGGIWLFFFDNPLYFIGVEAMAKMFHPVQFADIDPNATLQTLTQSYLSIPLPGTFWSVLPSKP